MSFIQRLAWAVLPQRWAAAMEADSRRWMVRCPCGFAESVWDRGGIRWKATGEPRRYLRCEACGHTGWHTVQWQADQPVR